MPKARSEVAVAVLEGRIYVAGGLAQLGPTAAFEVYDSAADSWRELAPLPEALHHAGLAALDGRIYLTGGYDSMSFTPDSARAWVYDPKTDAWSRIADMPGPRAAHALAVLDGKLYVVGGAGDEPTALWTYDPAAGRWDESRAPLPTARNHLAAVVVHDRLYAIGGRREGNAKLKVLEIYDPGADAWRRGPDLPTGRSGIGGAVVGGRIHVVGGEAFSPGKTFAEHEAYDPETNAWSRLTDLPEARHGLGAAGIGGRLYVIGGASRHGWLTMVSLSDRVDIYGE